MQQQLLHEAALITTGIMVMTDVYSIRDYTLTISSSTVTISIDFEVLSHSPQVLHLLTLNWNYF